VAGEIIVELIDNPYGLDGTIHTLKHTSRILEGNALGDPHMRLIHVYLPPEYEQEMDRSFPAVYCLTGYTGSGVMLLNTEGWTPNLPQRLERLRAANEAEPMILVMINCFTRLGGSQYINSSATGRYEDYLTQEIVPTIDARYRTLASARHRGIMGKSSGGYGAIVQGMRHPELFGAIACHSGDMYFEYCYLPDMPKMVSELRKHGGLMPFLEMFEKLPKKTHDAVMAMNMIAMTSCYSPNPMRPPMGFDLPFREETGEMRVDVWERWLAHDPVRMLPDCLEALTGARLVYVDCGIKDEFNLHIGARIFCEELRKREIPHVHEEFDDGHMRITYRYERSLALLSEAIRG
jgi:enterochelin esterase family protein